MRNETLFKKETIIPSFGVYYRVVYYVYIPVYILDITNITNGVPLHILYIGLDYGLGPLLNECDPAGMWLYELISQMK